MDCRSSHTTKEHFEEKGIFDKFYNILKLNDFRNEVKRLTILAKSKYNVDEGAIYSEENNGKKAVPNFKAFAKIDGIKKWRAKRDAGKGIQGELFGLNQGNLEFHVNTLGVISQFLENIGINQRLVPAFLNREGNVIEGALAAANFLQGTVDIIDDVNKRPEAWNKLPEEAAHWWYRLLKENSPLKQKLWETAKESNRLEALQNQRYANYASSDEFTEEAIGQLIAESIKRIEEKNASKADYSFFKAFLEWVNSVIDKYFTFAAAKDPFEIAAMKILSSDLSDLLTWDEYRELNNIVNFTEQLDNQSVKPIDYTLIEDIGRPEKGFDARKGGNFSLPPTDPEWGYYHLFITNGGIESEIFNTPEELDKWVYKEYGHIIDQRQKEKLQEVRDNQKFYDRLLNKTFRKRSKFLPKTLKKYYSIVDSSNLSPLPEWNISNQLQQVTKKLSKEEKELLENTNNYTNVAPTLKVLPDILKKYSKNPISLAEPLKIDGAKKQELHILNGIKDLIKEENPDKKSISSEDFVNEVHNWLEVNYLLGFADETAYTSYRIAQTFQHVSDRQTNEDIDLTNMTDEQLAQLPLQERQRIANILGLTKQNPSVYHNKVSIRFNDKYHTQGGHFNYAPSAWGNLTYFYTGNSKQKDAVLLHEIQNDNIERLRNFKAQKVDLDESLNRYFQTLNNSLLENIQQIESGGKKIVKNSIKISEGDFYKSHNTLNNLLRNYAYLPLQQGLATFKQSVNEQINLYTAYGGDMNDVGVQQKRLDEAYSKKRKWHNFIKVHGGIKNLLTKDELDWFKEVINEANTKIGDGRVTVGDRLVDMQEGEEFYEPITEASITVKKKHFEKNVIHITAKINSKLKEMYPENPPTISLQAPAKALPKSQRTTRITGQGRNARVTGNSSTELNDNLNFLIAFNEKKVLEQLSKKIEEVKLDYIHARNQTVAYNFNKELAKITPEQWEKLVENYKFNIELLDKLVDEAAKQELSKVESTESEYSKLEKIGSQNQLFEELKEEALKKKEELAKSYKKVEEEVQNTLEIEMNYFTPLVHHLIQKHISKFGKDFPMYFSGYNITKLTQGSDRTAWIYAGKEEVQFNKGEADQIKAAVARQLHVADYEDNTETAIKKT